MLTALMIGIPIFFVVAGALGVLSFAAPLPDEQPAQPAQPRAVEAPVAVAVVPDALFRPQWPTQRPGEDLEALLGRLDAHLRSERVHAAAFARDPSPQNLWVN